MKKLYLALCLLLLVPTLLLSDPLTLAWNYPTNEMSTNLTFKMYHSLSVTNPMPWTVVTNIIGTSLLCSLDVVKGEHYFYVTASNMWGESLPSNVWGSPPVAKTVTNLKITTP